MGPGKSSSNKIINEDEQEVVLGNQNMREMLAQMASWNSISFSSPRYNG